uniref:Capsid protein n=1 Tax=Plant associated genomovirus 1 TaxID=2584380 RepID=A0A4Y5QCU7_9VIRU|nr:capsid protein [Plant associated genomovirus 1]
MAYSRIRRRRVRRRRNPIRRNRVTRTRRVRTYRSRRMRLPRRSILNLTSVKKKDSMGHVTNVGTGSTTTFTTNPAIFTQNGAQPYATSIWMFSPSARDQTINAGGSDEVAVALRNSTRTYSKGYGESIQIRTNTGASWKWRRVVILNKNTTLYGTPGSPTPIYRDTAGTGMQRIVAPLNNSQFAILTEQLIVGNPGSGDSVDIFAFKFDPNRCKVLYDKTVAFNGGNQYGWSRSFNQYFPIQKTVVYNETENADSETSNYLSAPGALNSAGDILVIDFLACQSAPDPASGAPVHSLSLTLDGRYYWHER